MNVLHRPAAIQVGDVDYYPNAVVRVTVADATGRVRALGAFSVGTGTVLTLAK